MRLGKFCKVGGRLYKGNRRSHKGVRRLCKLCKATGMENIIQGEVSAKLWKSFARSEKTLQLMRKFAQGGWEVVQGIENTAKVVESFCKGMEIFMRSLESSVRSVKALY